jgi:hypothetical protein
MGADAGGQAVRVVHGRGRSRAAAAGALLTHTGLAIVPLVALAGVIEASGRGELLEARHAGAVAAGLWLLALGLLGPVMGRGSWRALAASGLVQEALLRGAGRRHVVLLVGRRAGAQLGELTASWWLLPFLLIGLGGWVPAESGALVVMGVLYGAAAVACGVLGAWTEGPGRERPAMGILMVALLTLPCALLAVRGTQLVWPTDLASWLCRALARATPLGALRPAWAEGPSAPRALVPPVALAAVTAWALIAVALWGVALAGATGAAARSRWLVEVDRGF